MITQAPLFAELEVSPSADYSATLHHALHSMEGAGERWTERRNSGLDDEQLKTAIGYEFGDQGGFCNENTAAYKGGKDPAFYHNTIGTYHKPTLHGQQLINAVRDLLEIPRADIQGALWGNL